MKKIPVWKVAGIVVLASIFLIAVFTLLGAGSWFIDLVANVGTLSLFVLAFSGGFQLVKKVFSS